MTTPLQDLFNKRQTAAALFGDIRAEGAVQPRPLGSLPDPWRMPTHDDVVNAMVEHRPLPSPQYVTPTMSREELTAIQSASPVPQGPVSAAFAARIARGRPRTALEDVGHALGGVVAEPAIEGVVQAAPFLMGTVHAIPDVLKAEGQYITGQPSDSIAATLNAGKAKREAATEHYAAQPLFGVGPSTNQVSQGLRGALGQPETPLEQVFGTISMLATPAIAEGVGRGLIDRAALPTAEGLAKPLTTDTPIPVEVPKPKVRDFSDLTTAKLVVPAEVPVVPRETTTEAPPMVGPPEDLTPLRRRFLAEQAALQPIPEEAPVKLPRGAPAVLGKPTEGPVEYKRNPKAYTDDEIQRRYTQVYSQAMDDAAAAGSGGDRGAQKFAGLQSNNAQRYLANLRDEVARRGIDPEALEEAAPLSRRAQQLMQTYRGVDERTAIQSEAPERPRSGALTPDVPFDPQSGKGALPILGSITGTGVGATVGAKQDPDHPLRGALLGGLAGAAGGGYLGAKAEGLNAKGITSIGEEAPKPAPIVEGPLRKPDANTVGRMIDLTPEEQQRVSSVLRQLPDKGVESHRAVTAKAAEILHTDPASLRTIDPTRMTGAETLAAAMRVSDNEAKISTLTERYLKASGPEQADYGSRIQELQREQSDLLNKISAGGTAMGRDLNSRKILARMSNNPVSWMLRAQQIAERPLTDVERATIQSFFKSDTPASGMNERGALGFPRTVTGEPPKIGTPEQQAKIDALGAENRRAEMLRYIGTLRARKWYEYPLTAWKSGLLTNPATHAANLASNIGFAASEEAARPLAAGFDALAGVFTGARTKAGPSGAILAASAKGALQGLKAIPREMRGLPTMRVLEQGEIPREVWFGNPVLTAVVNGPFRALEASDRVFFTAALQGSLAEQATLMARVERAGASRVRDLIEHPTPEMSVRAVQDAMLRTFKDETPLGQAMTGFKKPLGPVGEAILPFTKTPASIATRVAEGTPYGIIKGALLLRKAVKVLKDANIPEAETLSRGLQQQGAEVAARGTLGSSLMLAGYLLQRHGLASGTVSDNDRAGRAENQLEGKPSDAFLIGKNWFELNRLGPWAMLMNLGAAIGQADQTGTTTGDRVSTGLTTAGRIVADQPFLQGVQTALDAVHDPGNAGANYLKRLGTSVIPAGVAAAARAEDAVIRDAKTFPEQLQVRIPGQSQKLPAKPDQLGQPSQRMAPGTQQFLSPVRVSPDKRQSDPLLAELDRLNVDLGNTQPIRNRESRADWRNRATATGTYLGTQLRTLIQDPRYAALSDPQKAEVIARVVSQTRAASTRQQQERLGPKSRTP